MRDEIEALRVFISRHREIDGEVLRDGRYATPDEIAELKIALASFEILIYRARAH